MNHLSEVQRFSFVAQRDGKDAALAFARACIHIYLASVKSNRKKRGRNCPFRREHLESAFSFRHIVRTIA